MISLSVLPRRAHVRLCPSRLVAEIRIIGHHGFRVDFGESAQGRLLSPLSVELELSSPLELLTPRLVEYRACSFGAVELTIERFLGYFDLLPLPSHTNSVLKFRDQIGHFLWA